MMRYLAVFICMASLTGCSFVSFDEYDYETHEDAHIRVKGVDADVHKVHGGLLVGKKIKLGKPKPTTKKAKSAPE